jgi:hypothetical protein
MIDVETVSEAFIKWLEDNAIGEFNTDLYLNEASDDAPDICYWVLTNGGTPIQKLVTGEQVKQYFVLVNRRHIKGKELERDMFKLENLLNTPNCLTLEGFEVQEVEANQFPSDADFDREDRRVGLLQANIKIYKKEQ